MWQRMALSTSWADHPSSALEAGHQHGIPALLSCYPQNEKAIWKNPPMPFTSHRNLPERGGLLPVFRHPCLGVGSNPGEPALGSPGGLQRKSELYILALISRDSQAGCSIWTPAFVHPYTGEHICVCKHTHRHSVATAFWRNSPVSEHHMTYDSGLENRLFNFLDRQ